MKIHPLGMWFGVSRHDNDNIMQRSIHQYCREKYLVYLLVLKDKDSRQIILVNCIWKGIELVEWINGMFCICLGMKGIHPFLCTGV